MKLIFLFLIPLFLHSSNIEKREFLKDIEPSLLKTLNPEFIKKYSSLKNIKTANNFKLKYEGNDFIKKSEFYKIKNYIEKITKENTKKKDYILYFTSESVPFNTMLNIVFQVSLLQKNGIPININQYYIGFNNSFQDVLLKVKEKISSYPKEYQSLIANNYIIRLGPKFFNYFNLKAVPAMALASCIGDNPRLNNCEIKYFIKGDSSLIPFFDKISDIDKKYKKYIDILTANKLTGDNNENK
jgi:hypothetical protein